MGESNQTIRIYTSEEKERESHDRLTEPILTVHHKRKKITPGERLLRNSALACAILLFLLSLQNIDHPVTQSMANVVTKAVTLDFDADTTLGELQFVRHFLPESALVFWNITGVERCYRPAEGQILHDYTNTQPWYLFSALPGDPVYVTKSGTLAEARKTDAGDWALLLKHADNTETRYAYVERGPIKEGDTVSFGDVLTQTSDENCIYVEYLRDGKPVAVEEWIQ